MITCTRRIQFCAGHRVHRHESKCRNLHGHNYVVYFDAEAPELDDLGRVIDFGILKTVLGGWIDENWDHGFILDLNDVEALNAVKQIPNQKWATLEVNPTAENMAKYLVEEICPMLFKGSNVRIRKVTLWETENCYATAEI